MRSYIYYTTKIVPERYLLDNEREDDFRGMPKVCDFARFVCGIAHSAQGDLLIVVKFISAFYTNYLPFIPISEGEKLKRADVF